MFALVFSAVILVGCVAGFAYIITHYPKNDNKHKHYRNNHRHA